MEFGALPPGVSMSNSGLLSGTPTKAGSYPFLVYIDDSTGASAHQNYTLNVAAPGLLITAPSPLPAGQINVPYTAQLSATGGVGAPFFWSATGLPNGLTIANNSGLIAGIPRASGSFPIGVTAGDSSGATVTQSYTLTIASTTLTITTSALPNGAVGSSYNAAVSASGGSGTYTFAATGLPAGVTLASSAS
ncbi:MAG: putative Ig domain-containing protein [Ignavibacteriota bacterium]